MRIKILKDHNMLNIRKGDIEVVRDDVANIWIKYGYADVFNYPFPDKEILLKYQKFEISTYSQKLDLFMEAFSITEDYETGYLLKSGEWIPFEILPQNGEEWYAYNTRMIDYLMKTHSKCSLKGLIQEFKIKSKNNPNLTTLISQEKDCINSVLANHELSGILYWYKRAISGLIPRGYVEDETKYDISPYVSDLRSFLSRDLSYGVHFYLQGIALADYLEFLKVPDKDFSAEALKLNEDSAKDSRPSHGSIVIAEICRREANETDIKVPQNDLQYWVAVAKRYGWNSKTSPERLRNKYYKLARKEDRYNHSESKVYFKAAIDLLVDYPGAKKVAENELKEVLTKKNFNQLSNRL